MDSQAKLSSPTIRMAAKLATFAILISVLAQSGAAQSTKGQQLNNGNNNRPQTYGAAPSPVTQLRQQQQQNYLTPTKSSQTNRAPASNAVRGSNKSPQRNNQQAIVQQQQQRDETPISDSTEDPLADSEPALYGSVAGKPGVDFPAYTRIPKTSFSCENKGNFDFAFYADEEAGCQVYHVCWSGRRESFLCGVGTVFNQAILACDYWHSVDCSKSSQFYGVNSELGKAGAEPASNSQRQPARLPANAGSSSSSLGGSNNQANYGEPLNQRRPQQFNVNADDFDAPQQQQQQQQVAEAPIQQQQQQQQVYGTKGGQVESRQPQQQQQQQVYGSSTFAPVRSTPTYDSFQRVAEQTPIATKRQPQSQTSTTTLATTPANNVKQRQRFNMDFNQKVNSLIESPVRAPLSKVAPPPPTKQRQQQPPRQPQPQQQPANFAQLAVSRAQQSGSQTPRKGASVQSTYQSRQDQQQPIQQQQIQQQQQQQQQQVQSFDNELDEPQVQQQQQQSNSFDDSPVQTSTSNYNTNKPNPTTQSSANNNFVPQQTIIQAGGSGDGSSAITTQYDTLTPVGGQSNEGQSYDSSASLDSDSNSAFNDDFRSAGAKAAASHNQNWYIMRSI